MDDRDLPQDHPPTQRESDALLAAMKVAGVPAATRAEVRWSHVVADVPSDMLRAAMLRHPSQQPRLRVNPRRLR